MQKKPRKKRSLSESHKIKIAEAMRDKWAKTDSEVAMRRKQQVALMARQAAVARWKYKESPTPRGL